MNAVVTVVTSERSHILGGLTIPTLQAYAERIGADFRCIDRPIYPVEAFEILQIFDLLRDYQRIIFLDADCIVREDCPNLFEVIPEDCLGAFNEGQFLDGSSAMQEGCQLFKIDVDKWDRDFLNPGVLVVSRKHRELFSSVEVPIETPASMLSALLNIRIANTKAKTQDLNYKFNRMSFLDSHLGEDRHSSYIIHYSGAPNHEMVLPLISKDLTLWKDGFRGKQHIWIKVSGGLGDQVCAEPVIRWAREHVWPDAEIIVTSNWPHIFNHLNGTHIDKLSHHKDFLTEVDTPYYIVETVPEPTKMIWQFLSHAMCHCVDFIAISLLKRTIPELDKQIHIEVSELDIENLKRVSGLDKMDDLVLVHPGRHWPSKTFPREWWESVVSGLVEAGLRVAIIGKHIGETQGYIDLDLPDGVLDLRDLLGTQDLFALISRSKVVITNDSAPTHIAGAFETNIILIPTVKHPDHVLPYRHGDKYYKAVSLYKKLTCEDFCSAPTEIHGVTLDGLNAPWEEYLVDTEVVVKSALKCFDSDG